MRIASDALAAADDSLADGNIRYTAAGRSRQGEEGTLETGQILVERLNQDGACWSQPKRPDKETGVDCQASAGRNVLKIQVTRAVIDREFWRTLSQSGSVSDQSMADECANALKAAIDHKVRNASEDVVLALNAIDTPRLAFQATGEYFRRKHGAWAAQVGFKEIWVVGPTAKLTSRLDVPL